MTRKPCPGCGEVDRCRPADAVCSKCAQAIKNWNAYKERLESPGAEMVTVGLKGAYHWYPMFYFGDRSHCDELSELRETLARAFPELGEGLCEDVVPEKAWDYTALFPDMQYKVPDPDHKKGTPGPQTLDYPCSKGGTSCGVEKYGLIRKDRLELLRKLWDATARFTELAYLTGLKEGKDLLKQLASGGITVAELQEEDRKIGERVQNARKLHRAMKGFKLEAK